MAHVNRVTTDPLEQSPSWEMSLDSWFQDTNAQAVIFPPADELLTSNPLRNVTCCAMLRLRDRSIRFLRATNTAWTTANLEAVERMLANLDGDRPASPEIFKRRASEIGIPTLTLANVIVDRVDSAAWNLRRTAVAAVTRDLRVNPDHWDPTRAAAATDAIEQRYRAGLERALASFVSQLDPQVRDVASDHGPLDVSLHNFLVREPHRLWRLQFARTFPILVHVAVNGPPGSGGARIRAMVDTGLPLFKSLAARWAVTPGALRCLSGRAVEHVGARWQDRPHALARILDALRPEDRPGDDPTSWKRLANAVAIAEEIFHRPVTSSPLTLGWLRTEARTQFARLGETADETSRGLPPEAIAFVDRLRTALVQHLTDIAAADYGDPGGEMRVAAATVADRRLAALSPSRLAMIAKKFTLEYAHRRAVLVDEMRLAEGRVFLPLLPRDLIATSGARRVTSLTTRADVRGEGLAQHLCIKDGSELASIVHACVSGSAYLLSVRHVQTGEPLSTAEIRVVRHLGVGLPTLRVQQHKARGNANPSAACAAALREALAFAAGREGQKHLEHVWRQARHCRNSHTGSVSDQDTIVTANALRLALGDDLHAALEQTMKRICIEYHEANVRVGSSVNDPS